MQINFKHLKTAVIYFVVHGVITLAVLFSAIRLAMPYVTQHLPTIEKLASEKLGVRIDIDKMDTGWRGLGPVLRFEGVTLFNVETNLPLATADLLDISLDPLGSLRHWTLMPGRLTFSGLSLIFEQQPDGVFRLRHHGSESLQAADQTLGDLLKHSPEIDLQEGEIQFIMQKGSPLDLHLNYLSFKPGDARHHFEAELTGKKLLGKLKIIADLKGDLHLLSETEVEGYLHLTNVQFDARLMPWELFAVKPLSGQMTLDAWFDWRQGHWHELIGKFALSQAVLGSAKQPNFTLPLDISADIAWQRLGGDFWRLSGDNIALKLGETGSPLATFMLEAGPGEPWNFRLNQIAIDDVLDLLALSDQIDQEARDAIKHLNVQGELHDLQWLGTPTEEGFKDWRMGILLDGLHWQAYHKIPAVKHISGEIKLTEHQGQFTLNSQDLAIDLPTWYEQPLVFHQAEGLVSWKFDQTWLIHTDNLSLQNEDFTLDTLFTFEIPKNADLATIDLITTSGELSEATAKKYLPTRMLNPATTKWIQDSVVSGKVSGMKTIIKGPMKDLPFKKGEGEFDMRFSLEDVLLKFHPAWPAIEDLSGDLVIEGDALQAYVDKGSFQNAVIANSKVMLPFSKAPDPLNLQISGVVATPSQDALDFIKASPLWEKLGSTFELVTINGPLSIDFNTQIPLRAGTGKPKVQGKVSMSNGNLSIQKWNLNLDDVVGTLAFTQNTVSSEGITGAFLGRKGVLTATTRVTGEESEITWNFHSVLNKSLIEYFARSDYWHYLEGEAPFDLSFNIHLPPRQDPLSLTLSSDLKGLALKLPAPMMKTATQSLPSTFTLSFLPNNLLTATFHYGQEASGSLIFNKAKEGYELMKGQLLGGREPSALPMPTSGLSLTGTFPHLAIQPWIDFFQQHQTTYPKKGSDKKLPFSISDLRIADLHYKDLELKDVLLNAQRHPEYWQIDLISQEVEGKIQMPHYWETMPLVLELSRCTWPLSSKPSPPKPMKPTDLHEVRFTCGQFFYKKSDIGRFTLNIMPQPGHNGVSFDPIRLETPSDQLTASGSWVVQNGQQLSRFTGQLSSQDIGKTLRAWAVPTDVQDAKGESTFDLRWPGSPRDMTMKNLSGDFDLSMEKGRFVGVNPGFGRMLGLLSFQSLQRRIRLDFSDIFKEGFAFDTFKTHVTILSGVANLNKTQIKAPAADIQISGTTHLANHSLDVDMLVQAHVDSTVPAAAVAIANPAAGAAFWIVDKVFNPLGNVTRYRYHVTGTWENPEYTDLTKEYRDELSGPAKVEELN